MKKVSKAADLQTSSENDQLNQLTANTNDHLRNFVRDLWTSYKRPPEMTND